MQNIKSTCTKISQSILSLTALLKNYKINTLQNSLHLRYNRKNKIFDKKVRKEERSYGTGGKCEFSFGCRR